MAVTVLAYDITDDRRRARLAATLQAWGDRIQLSVFVCDIGEDDLNHLLERARDIVDPEQDSVYVLRQCHECWETMTVIGQATHPKAHCTGRFYDKHGLCQPKDHPVVPCAVPTLSYRTNTHTCDV